MEYASQVYVSSAQRDIMVSCHRLKPRVTNVTTNCEPHFLIPYAPYSIPVICKCESRLGVTESINGVWAPPRKQQGGWFTPPSYCETVVMIMMIMMMMSPIMCDTSIRPRRPWWALAVCSRLQDWIWRRWPVWVWFVWLDWVEGCGWYKP